MQCESCNEVAMTANVRKWIPVVIVFLAVFLGGSAAAQGLQDFFNVPHATLHIGKLKADNGAISCSQIDSKSKGPVPCSSAFGFPVGFDTCGAIQYSCSNTGGTAGNGNGTMVIEFDLNAGLSSRGSGNDSSLAPDCYPIVGSYGATGKRDAFLEATGFAGVACDPLTGQAAQIIGGWQLLDWALVPFIPDGAGGTFTGTMNVTTGALKLVLTGKTF